MTTENYKKYIELRKRFEAKMNEPEVISDGEIISLYDLVEILKSELNEFNNVLITGSEKYIKTLNTIIGLHNLFGNKIPYISKIIPEVRKGGNCIIKLIVDNDYDAKESQIVLAEGNEPLFINVDFSKYSKDKTIKLLNDCINKFSLYFIMLNRFKSKYGNIEHVFDDEHPDRMSIYHYNDGFIHAKIDLNNPSKCFAIFSSYDDFETARLNIKQLGGEIFEYLEFYNKNIEKRCPVSINCLNELYKSIVNSHLSLGEQKTLKK